MFTSSVYEDGKSQSYWLNTTIQACLKQRAGAHMSINTQNVQIETPKNSLSLLLSRHIQCSVCRTDFTVPPPTRMELLEDMSGFQAAALRPGALLIATDSFSNPPSAGIPLLWQVTTVMLRFE